MKKRRRIILGGWQGLGKNRGRFVDGQDGFAVACAGCGVRLWDPRAAEAAEFRAMLEEWYFSGDGIWKEDDDGQTMEMERVRLVQLKTG